MTGKPRRKPRKQKKQAIHIEQPTEQVVRALFPGLAEMQDELQALGCKVKMKVGSIQVEVQHE